MKSASGLRNIYANIFQKLNSKGKSDVYSLLRGVPIFNGLHKPEIKEVSQLLHKRDYEDNEYVFEINHPGSALYIVKSGSVSVEIPSTKGQIKLAELKAGDFVGELALLENTPRSASARVIGRAEIYALFRNDLNKLISTHPQITSMIYKALANVIASRLVATNSTLKEEKEKGDAFESKRSAS